MANLPGLLTTLPDAPTQDQIEQWKTVYGSVYVSGMSQEELFVFRPLSRKEYLLSEVSAAQKQAILQQQNPNMKPEEVLEKIGDNQEEVVTTCILWPANVDLSKKAGTISTLYEQIIQNSNFVPAEMAGLLVAKL